MKFIQKKSGSRAKKYTSNGICVLKPIKSSQGVVLNKAGRLVLGGVLDGKQVKLFEAYSPAHALFVEKVLTQTSLSNVFPGLIYRFDRFLVVNWVPGRTLDSFLSKKSRQILLEKLLEIQQLFHMHPVVHLPLPDFDYWKDLIFPRFERAAGFIGVPGLRENVLECVNEALTVPEKLLMHPDLTPRNIIVSKSGEMRVIDNELITIGRMPLLDICNTALGLGKVCGQIYFEAYLELTGTRMEGVDLLALRAAWLARSVGSAFVAGKMTSIKEDINNYKMGRNILPVDIP